MDERLTRLEAAVQSGRLRSRDVLQQRLGRLKLETSRVARASRFHVEGDGDALSFSWTKDEAKAQYTRHTEGACLLRTNLAGREDPELWKMYMQLNDAEAAFRTLKQDLSIRPVHHHTENRMKARVRHRPRARCSTDSAMTTTDHTRVTPVRPRLLRNSASPEGTEVPRIHCHDGARPRGPFKRFTLPEPIGSMLAAGVRLASSGRRVLPIRKEAEP
jgi:hypothetical protein